MHLEDYHGERSEEDEVRRPVSAGLDDFADDASVQLVTSMALTTMSIGVGQPHCWTTSQSGDGLLSPLDSGADPREYLDWNQAPTVFQYPSQYPSIGDGSPESSCSEAITPTWSNNSATATTDDGSDKDKSDCCLAQKLPSVGSAFSFSRTFCNTVYPEYGAESSQSYQDYQDCHEDVVSLLMSMQNDCSQGHYGSSQTSVGADEFDLSLIRGDPTSLLTAGGAVDSSSSPSSPPTSCLSDDLRQESFQNLNGQYYAVGHLVSSQPSTLLSTISLACEIGGATESFGNQVILPRNEGLLLGDRRVAAAPVEREKNNKIYGEFAGSLAIAFTLIPAW